MYLGINTRHPVAGNIDARIQNIDPRTRMILQRPQVAATITQQHFQGNQALQTRMPAARNTITEPYDVLQQQRFPGGCIFYIIHIILIYIIIFYNKYHIYRSQSRAKYNATDSANIPG